MPRHLVSRITSVAGAALSAAVAMAPLVACLLVASAVGPAAPPPSSRETAACIRDPQCHRPIVVGHRANGLGAPENSRAAVASAVKAGVPVVKIDVRASKDGELFVIHDGKLDRTTSRGGRIEGIAAADLERTTLANGETLPRFADVYPIARGRLVLTVGFKTDALEVTRMADWIAANGSFDDLIFFVNTGEQMRAAADAKKRYPAMIVMVRLLDTRVTVESTRAVFGRLPEIFHTERVGRGEVRRLQALGTKVYMNLIPWEGYIQPVRWLALWWILRTGLDLIQTDDPLAMMRRVGRG